MGELDGIRRRQLAAATLYSERFTDAYLGEAQRIVPHDEGTLGATADRETEIAGNMVVITGYFSTPYARRQHEEEGWEHKEGRQAKYLEAPFNRAAGRYAVGMAAALRGTLR